MNTQEFRELVTIHEDSDTYVKESKRFRYTQSRPTYDTQHTVLCKECKAWTLGDEPDRIYHKPGCSVTPL